ncbi:hypothetical protein IHE44_0004922 [Lamprotornis superbus]|uniref:Protein ripply3 n=1 Tax=Lamprotornis superbus TaxID=245042 RepID=A0A835NR16_9PASS|nr:hypothetical protein IHE44_0004922 [Lamprotornis superbus]
MIYHKRRRSEPLPGFRASKSMEGAGGSRSRRSRQLPGEHLARLYLPKSRSQKFLANIGQKVLASFPVQATIHFYNDDAESEEEEMSPERPQIFFWWGR